MGTTQPLEEIPVMARLSFGTELLHLVLTQSSIIVAHLGKRGAGSVVGSSFLGRLSGAIEDLFKSGRESGIKKKIRNKDPARILAADKDNFRIDYADIVSVDIDGTNPAMNTITVLTKDDKYQFYTVTKYERITELFEKQLGTKANCRRL